MEKIIALIITSLAFLVAPLGVSAASLVFSPASGKYSVGQTVSVSVYVQSNEQEMNAVSGTVSFPPDSLELISLSKLGSIISLWVQEPSFSNTKGQVTFEGIVLNPGYKGSQGKVLTVIFKVKKEGQASLNFSSGSLLANDGAGTNILYNVKPAVLSLVAKPVAPKTEEVQKKFGEKLDAQFGLSDVPNPDASGQLVAPVEPVGLLSVILAKYSLLVVQPVLLAAIAVLNIFIFYKFFRMAHMLHTRKPSIQRTKLIKYEDLVLRQVSSLKKAKKHRHLSKEEEELIKEFQKL